MFFGLDAEKFLLIGMVAVLVLGPRRLPQFAKEFARFLAKARVWAGEAKSRVKEEMGDDVEGVDWRQLDPRQYDPRRIIRQALLEEPPAVVARREDPTESPMPRADPVSPQRDVDEAERNPSAP